MTGPELDGSNRLFRALKDAYGSRVVPAERLPDGKPVNRAASPCPVCVARGEDATWLTVALDENGEPASCYRGCSEDAIWRALGQTRPPHRKRTAERGAPPQKRTARATVPKKRTARANTHRDGNTHRDESTEGNISMGVLPEAVAKELGENSSDYDAIVATSKNEARARLLGLPSKPGIDFGCVLPGHKGHTARLRARERGLWVYQCDKDGSLSLADVQASLATGRAVRLSGVQACRWLERLDYEAGLLQPRPVPIRLDPKWSEGTTKVAQKLALFLGLRSSERWGDDTFTFGRNFIIAYCHVTDDEARWAMRVLERDGVICRVGWSGPLIVWRLGR